MQSGEVLHRYYPEISTQSQSEIILGFSIQTLEFFVMERRAESLGSEEIPDR